MIVYMTGKLAPNSTHFSRGLVKYVPGRDCFRAVPSQSEDNFATSPPQSLNDSPLLSEIIISLSSLALKGHTYAGDKDDISFKLIGRETVYFPLIGKLCRQYGHHLTVKGKVVDTSCAVFASGQAKAPTTPTDIKTFYCTYGHTHEVQLMKTVEQQRVNLSWNFHECRGCSMANGLRKPIARLTHTRQSI